MKAKAFYHRVCNYGPGGYHCPCCGPAPSMRRKERQQQRRKFHRLLDVLDKFDTEVKIEHDNLVLDDFDDERHDYYNGWGGDPSLHDEWKDWKKAA
ncbi:hypothetical protein H1O16_gp205 [Burkholderia phage BcepSaruman]|uniref:Uncharacterized protein n=1 Tax=Burkholderia phage BcepSaruman TaxID=2530032 RepID=A0A4D5ZHS6_9CAUD|nr:hypothetical protein H1O16_gp205 [Burkholderia phage BcepSaruman]QBX06618.1 hypothetical protein BcepSaruman_205 [Burkholderia phage BcepSaruman]